MQFTQSQSHKDDISCPRSPFLVNYLQYPLLLLLLSHFSRVRLCVTRQTEAHQAPPSWDSPGKNTGVGCHFFLQCMKVKSESEVAQSCSIFSNPMDCSLPGSSINMGFSRQEYWSGVPLPSPCSTQDVFKSRMSRIEADFSIHGKPLRD